MTARVRRAVVAGILGVAAAFAPRPALCNTYVRDDLNLLRADTFSAIQRRNADLIARTGACIDVITVVIGGDDLGRYALDSARAFGNHCSLGAAILITQGGGGTIRFEDASAGFQSSWQTITQALGDGIGGGDINGAVMTAVNAIADGIIDHPPPSQLPVVSAIPSPPPSIGDAIIGFLSASWQTAGGRIGIICVSILALALLARSIGFGRAR
jgi:hypothetical protein